MNNGCTKEQIAIMEHAKNSPNRAYCTEANDKDLLSLVKKGFFSNPIKTGYLPKTSAYFQLTSKGLEYLRGF